MVAALVLSAGVGCEAPTLEPVDTAGAEQAIRAVMDAQVAAWNQGDVAGFMEGYWSSDSLRFASGGNVYRGWQATLDGYHTRYPDRASMGTLTFDSLDVQVFSGDWATVFGRWHLARTEQPDASGLFTLLFERRPEGWRIVHDHTSSAQ